MRRVLVTLSGGSDSAYAALIAKKYWPDAEFHSLFVNYGQPELAAELEASVEIHNKLCFIPRNWRDVRIWGLYHFNRKLGDQMSLYIAHRNLVIASVAAAMAEDLKADTIVVGNKSHKRTEGDPLTYDGNREFYNQLTSLIRSIEVTDNRVTIIPTLSEFFISKLTRKDCYFGLWSEGFKYDDTFSCWYAIDGRECGECKNCKDKKEIWEEWSQIVKAGLPG